MFNLMAGMDKPPLGFNDKWWYLLVYFGVGMLLAVFNATYLWKTWRKSKDPTNQLHPLPWVNRLMDSLYWGLAFVASTLVWPAILLDPIIDALRGRK